MSTTSRTNTDSRIDITKKRNRWGEFLEVVVDGMRHSFAIIDGTVLTSGAVDDDVTDAIEQRGYEVA
ncbi:hypothetical protein PN419_00570 [Halorubrum ezzemoulense]|uniref:hypothetical protein n=1 Tax=Halorubrum ezzemoulense TaxID=337243 RepID=UPI00232FC21B|nr:hypothetical protein [Halorubrum ezzemoulense]MDB9247501.1 hypothetical protein [Halorubrum ezzemoulense]MDB9258590.1 hypothetical protein [Halorubrum ezzemoulense]MDB9264551.1 hypothetical protein [Halorubrum ezzemoulense]MDB9268951.1 hypothetical protein [Halorubrum ezzemoulense]MDB9271519.1 hypothetical protein [Halorubrum ezzemoulense]